MFRGNNVSHKIFILSRISLSFLLHRDVVIIFHILAVILELHVAGERPKYDVAEDLLG